jgi:predicted nucleic acid-binding protein
VNAFVDTNILVYAAEESAPHPRKTRIARELLLQPDLHLSVQVLNEFVANARNPRKLNFTPLQEGEWVRRWLRFPIASLDADTFLIGLGIHHRHGISHWDALILASARQSNCSLVYSEDLSTQQDYDGIRVVNPFA